MDKKEKTKYIIFIGFFLALLYAVPITQAIAERLKNTRIQALDIAEDALVTPYRNAKKIHDLALQQTFFIDSLIKEVGSPQDSAGVHAQQVVDEALAGLTEMKKIAFTINKCPGGGIGIRASLRNWFSQGIGGSSPLLGTK